MRQSFRKQRRRLAICALGICVLLVAGAGGLAGAAKTRVTCPLDAKGAKVGELQWAFSQYSAPTGPHRGLDKSYTHGHGTWNGGRARGTVCHQDMGGGPPKRHIVMRVSAAPSALHAQVMRLGHLGVELVLPLVVTRSDDDSCAVGTHGSVTLYASYYDVHIDRAILRFKPGCTSHDHTYREPALKVGIQRHGAQVNGP